ncbi:MAG TPA: DUF1611 domain-containing protein [Gemmatimonadota bacterium]|nr:DUF1611 domain-containing protein [Gemmatimonadota bacterium]
MSDRGSRGGRAGQPAPEADAAPAGAGRPARDAWPEGRAIVFCEGAFGTPYGKTAHGLVRRTARYDVVSVVDSRLAGRDAGEELDGRRRGIPIVADVDAAVEAARGSGRPATHLVVGLAPDGGRLPPEGREAVLRALELGLDVDAGLHDFLSEDPELAAAADTHGARIRDVRRPPPRSELHFFSGAIEEVGSFRVAVLGTDSAVGKRTTAWLLVDALRASGRTAELIGTGQTSWMQGARYGIVLDSLVNDFVSGEVEHAVVRAWREARPDVIVLEGQGSLMNPAYPGGFELLAAGRPHAVILQHAPRRAEYDGFPGFPLHPLPRQIEAIELLSGVPVVAVTVNHEGMRPEEVPAACRAIEEETGLPAVDVLLDPAEPLVRALEPRLDAHAAAAGAEA